MDKWGDLIIGFVIGGIVLFGLFKKVPVFDSFLSGASQGIRSALSVAPSMFALVVAVSMLRESGVLDIICNLFSPVMNFLGIPSEILPLCLIRPVSGSGATALLNSILNENGPDSLCGRIASVMAGSTETTFYAIAVYYGSVGIKNTRYTVPAALCADFTGMTLACFVVKFMM